MFLLLAAEKVLFRADVLFLCEGGPEWHPISTRSAEFCVVLQLFYLDSHSIWDHIGAA